MFSTSPQQSTLLVVDDNSVNLDLLVLSLGKNYDLRTAISGEIALNLISEGFSPDLILLDIMMPGMDGYEVCQRLKSDQATQNIPVIFLTSMDKEEDEVKGLEIGAVDYITKPFNPAIVRLRIQTQLELKQHRDHLDELVAKGVQELGVATDEAVKKEAYIQSILRSAPAGIGLTINRKIQWINQRMEEMVGYVSADLEGESARVLYQTEEDYEWVGQQKYAQISQFGTGSVDTQFVTKDGSVIDVYLSSTPLDTNDLSVGVIFTALDITERKQTEEALLLSENKFSRLFKLSPDAISLTRVTDGSYIEINQGFSKISGWQEEEIIGRSSIDLGLWCRDEDRDRVVSDLETYGEINGLEVLFQRKDGRIITGLFSARLIEISGENCIISITRDITEQKRIETDIIRAKEEWEATFDAMSDMVTIHDKNMKIVRANKAAHNFFGVEYGELNGKKCCEAFWGSETTCTGCPLLTTVKNGEQCSEILSYNVPNKTLLVTTAPIPDKSGQPEYFIHIARDITEQRQFEEEASRANRLASLGELAAGVAHEINNPNALILYNSDILDAVIKDLLHFVEDNPPADSKQLFGGLPYQEVAQEIPVLLPTIHDSALRIKRIVNDLRDFARQDSTDDDEAIDLNQVVDAAVRLVNNAVKKSTDYFTLNLAETLPAVTGVIGRLDQVVINLLLNACQALEDRSQGISITTVYEAAIEQVHIIVADEGQGMSAAVMEHIQEPFVTSKREQGGTGLGLSVSARIVKEHHGKLRFKSAPGEGTTATISLPVRKEDNHVS